MKLQAVAKEAGVDFLDRRWTGLDMRDLEPWWATAMRGWAKMIGDVEQAQFEGAAVWRTMLRAVLEKGESYPPRPFKGGSFGASGVMRLYGDFARQARSQ